MSGSLMKRAALQQKLAENFETEAESLKDKLTDILGEVSNSPEHDLSEYQRIAHMQPPEELRQKLQEKSQFPTPVIEQVEEQIILLNEVDYEAFHTRISLKQTNERRKQRRRQRQ